MTDADAAWQDVVRYCSSGRQASRSLSVAQLLSSSEVTSRSVALVPTLDMVEDATMLRQSSRQLRQHLQHVEQLEFEFEFVLEHLRDHHDPSRAFRKTGEVLAFLYAATNAFPCLRRVAWPLRGLSQGDPLCLIDALHAPEHLRDLRLELDQHTDVSRLIRMLKRLLPKLTRLRGLRVLCSYPLDVTALVSEVLCPSLLPTIASVTFEPYRWTPSLSQAWVRPAVAQVLSGLVDLQLAGTGGVGDASQHIAALRHCRRLRRLVLVAAFVTIADAEAAAAAIASMIWLDMLKVAFCSDAVAARVCAPNVLRHTPRLTRLVCTWCPMQSDVLARSLQLLPMLQKLDLTMSRFSSTAIGAVIASLHHLLRLERLLLFNLSAEDEVALAAQLPLLPRLTEVPMPRSPYGIIVFARDVVPALYQLRKLRLRPIDAATMASLAASLPDLPNLVSITLVVARVISHPGTEPDTRAERESALVSACLTNKSKLQEFFFAVPAATWSPCDAVAQAIAACLDQAAAPMLRKLSLTGVVGASPATRALFQAIDRRGSQIRQVSLMDVPPVPMPAIVAHRAYHLSCSPPAPISPPFRVLHEPGTLPGWRLPTLLELAAQVVLSRNLDYPSSAVPRELTQDELKHRFRACLLCSRATGEPRIACAAVDQDAKVLIDAVMCTMCFYAH